MGNVGQNTLRRALFFLLIMLLSIVASNCVRKSFSTKGADSMNMPVVRGIVLDNRNKPVARARVRIQGTGITTMSDSVGRFILQSNSSLSDANITAWKEGYYCNGIERGNPGDEHRIVLLEMPSGDNKNYEWIASSIDNPAGMVKGHNDISPCESCHPRITAEWKQNAHSQSAYNPVFLAFYNGSDNSDSTIGYRKNYKNSTGNCATCHMPVAAVHAPFSTDPNHVEGVALEGVSCDVCHKVRDVNVDDLGGRPGVLSMELHRPPREQHVFYGPFDDVFAVDESSYNPLYSESKICAPCHHGMMWENLVYGEYQEWLDSSYAKNGVTCQACHMPPTGDMDIFAPPELGAARRDANKVASHLQLGIRHPDFMRNAIALDVETSIDREQLHVTATVRNTGAGHHYPTGSPMRNLILVVSVVDDSGRALPLLQGETVPSWGGEGDPSDGNYAGMPGKGFAKIFVDIPHRYGSSSHTLKAPEFFPAPYWRAVGLLDDSRIPANGQDVSTYIFNLPNGDAQCTVSVRLIFRRSFKNWLNDMDMFLDIDDLELHSYKIQIPLGENIL